MVNFMLNNLCGKVYISIALADRYQDRVNMKVPYNEGDDSFYIGDENKIITGKINALYKFDKTVIVCTVNG